MENNGHWLCLYRSECHSDDSDGSSLSALFVEFDLSHLLHQFDTDRLLAEISEVGLRLFKGIRHAEPGHNGLQVDVGIRLEAG